MSDPVPIRRVVIVDGVPMSALVAAVPDPRAVVVALHGGATSSAYFDCPGHPRSSLVRLAAAHGYTAIALDRPGYGASSPHADGMDDANRRVALARAAVDQILAGAARGGGVFLVGHSAGCELALRLSLTDDVIGVELAGTGLRYRAAAVAVIEEATVTWRPAGLCNVLWQPTELYPPEVPTGGLSARGAAYEVDMTANWPRRDFAVVAAQVTVPVRLSTGDHESVWESTPEARAAIVALFTSSPRVTVNEVSDGGHNLSVGLTAESYHREVVAFVAECLVAVRRESERGTVEAG